MNEDGVDRLVGADRVLAVLRELAGYPAGVGLDELAKAVDSPKPTVHRALVALRRAGFASQDGRGHYVLGDGFLRLAFAHHELRPDHVRVHPLLVRLANRFGETAHYAVLDDRSIVYRSKVDPPTGAARLTSTIGGRNPAHCTAVGKLLLATTLPDDNSVLAWASEGDLEPRTTHTITTPTDLAAHLTVIREQGYATDDQENEVGVNCLAVPIFLTSPRTPSGAISISALTYRTPLPQLVAALPEIKSIMDETP
ncbi:MAG TPA: IclR family transcriptional regulator [Pseudonocardiaceae bacterium]|nr:IclR family transcriptional regulator [Pseudonocardiaceae bacterium]